MKKTGKLICCFTLAASLILGAVCLPQKEPYTNGAAAKGETKEKMDSAPVKMAGAKARGQYKIAIDAGHQRYANTATEPVGPGAKTKKTKVAGGATGVATKTPEHKLTLQVAKRLKKVLVEKGYQVYMIRNTSDVNISNKQRAVRANKSGADIYIRIHADASNSAEAGGASMLYPSAKNPYVKKLSKPSRKLSDCILKSYCKKTGIKSRGLIVRAD